MNKTFRLAGLIFALLAVGGCEKARDVMGLNKSAPDEFAVYQRAPLSLPPDYGLAAPSPGAVRQQQVDPRNQAQQVIGSIAGAPAGGQPATGMPAISPGLRVLLDKTGALNADPNIRGEINRETSILAEDDQTFTDRIMFWGTPNVYGSVVDPAKEARRIQENQALGRPITEGEVPTIERKRKALLEDIF